MDTFDIIAEYRGKVVRWTKDKREKVNDLHERAVTAQREYELLYEKLSTINSTLKILYPERFEALMKKEEM